MRHRLYRGLLAALLGLAAASPSHAATFEHFTGTSLPSGFTCGLNTGNGIAAMNGTIVSGSGGTPTAAISGETFFNFVTANVATDASICYRTVAIDPSTTKLIRFGMRTATTGSFYAYLNEGVPFTGNNTAVFGTAGKALLRIAAQNSAANLGIDRYAGDASRTRSQWNASTQAWEVATKNANATSTNTYSDVFLEIDGPNRRWRVAIVGNTGTAQTPTTSLYMNALTDWVAFSFHENGGVFCTPTCGSLYLTFGEPLSDSAAGTGLLEYYAESDGTKTDYWLNGRNAGGTWGIYHYTGLPDVNGVPAPWMPEDRTTQAIAVGGAGAWDEQHVKDPYVLKDGATYHMMFGGSRVADGKFQCGSASAASANGPWTKNPNNPLIALVAAGQRDQTLNCVLVKDEAEPDANKRWKILFVGADTSAPIRFRGFESHCSQPPTHASCDQAGEWSAPALIWDVGGVGAIDEIGCGRLIPVRSGGVDYLLCGVRALSGGVAQNRQETYGTSSDRWLSAVTKSGTITNASLVASPTEGNTTTSAAVTTANVRTLSVASEAGFDADELVTIDDDNTPGNYYVDRVLATSSGSLTLYHALDGSVSNLASGARVRAANAFNQIDTGPVPAYSGGFLKIATCFDPMVGSGSTFDAYQELACAWTGPSVVGPWTPYRLASPIAALNAFSRGASNENPSLVNLPLPLLRGGRKLGEWGAEGGAEGGVERSTP